MGKEFLGRGWSFPLGVDVNGNVALAEYEHDIKQAIYIILSTAPGERVMRPEFGAGLKALVFEPVNTITIGLVKHRVESALKTWEPRVELETVKVTTDPAERNKLLIEIIYRIKVSNSRHNLVYPFYLHEGDSS